MSSAAYFQDQIEFTRWLQFIGGVRLEQFALDYVNLNAQGAPSLFGQTFARTDNLVSPRAGIVIKPIDPLSLYGSYAVSYLPGSGDQFGALTSTSTLLQPEKFTNQEVGTKWDITPLLTLTTAYFQLDRENTRVPDPSGTAWSLRPGIRA